MACYVVVAGAWLLHTLSRGRITWLREEQGRLNTLLLGGAVVGILDHWWNGELLPVGASLASDLLLGALLVLGVIGVWLLLVSAGRLPFLERHLQ